MDSTNKIFATLLALSVVECVAITYITVDKLVNPYKTQEISLKPQAHPYNACVKLFIDQSNKQGIECDFDKAKSICFELVKSK